jgi:hypothetical protein
LATWLSCLPSPAWEWLLAADRRQLLVRTDIVDIVRLNDVTSE